MSCKGRLWVLKFPGVMCRALYVCIYRASDHHHQLRAPPQIVCRLQNYRFFLLGVVGYESTFILPRNFSLGLYRFASSTSLSNYFSAYVSYRVCDVCRRGSVTRVELMSVLQNFAAVVILQSNRIITTSVYATDFLWCQSIRYYYP
jgi:hypothetical protein